MTTKKKVKKGKVEVEVLEPPPPELVDLVKQILKFDPEQRPTMHDILRHKYFKDHFFEKDPLIKRGDKRLTPDQPFPEMKDLRQFMYEKIDEVHREFRIKRKPLVYYEKYTNYN